MAKENVTDDLRAELKTLADTLEEVLNSSADKSKEEMGKLRSKAESALKESRARSGETSEAILRQTRETAARADDYVRENPWTGVGIGAAMTVLDACCDNDLTTLIGEIRPAKASGKTFKIRRGSMDEFDMLVIAQSLITHGIIGKAKVRKLQRHENGETTTEFNAFEYISAARNHFGMSRAEAEQLSMTEFQLLIAAKYPDQKGFTKDEYDAVADEYLAKKARRLAKSG